MRSRLLVLVPLAMALAGSSALAQPARPLDLEPGAGRPMGSGPWQLTPCGPFVYFTAFTRATGRELWRTDGRRIELVEDVVPGSHGGLVPLSDYWQDYWSPELSCSGGRLFFTAVTDGAEEGELRVTDGASRSVPLGKGRARLPRSLVDAGGTQLFLASSPDNRSGLWRSDGTEAGTSLVSGPWPEEPMVASGGRVFAGGEATLWVSDGTREGTRSLFLFDTWDRPHGITAGGSLVYFQIETSDLKTTETWRSDGTSAGTFRLFSSPYLFYAAGTTILATVGQTLYFWTNDTDLWKSDGSPSGTIFVTRFGSAPGRATAWNGALWLKVGNYPAAELWRSDGTAASTVRISGIAPEFLLPTSTELYAVARDSSHGCELWRTDGTAAGTGLVADIRPGPDDGMSIYGASYGELDHLLVFGARDALHGAELFSTDGTAGGTSLIEDLEPGASAPSSDPVPLARSGDVVLFRATTKAHGFQTLWRTDGTAEGTYRIADLSPIEAVSLGERALVSVYEDLLVSDGTEVGTRSIFHQQWGFPSGFVLSGGRAFFSTIGIDSSHPMYVTDGTGAGTHVIPGFAGADFPQPLFPGLGFAWFEANRHELWRTDGVTARLVADVGAYIGAGHAEVPGAMLFDTIFTTDPEAETRVFRSDGSAGGTYPLLAGRVLGSCGSTALLSAPGELWRSDGTAAGTSRIRQLDVRELAPLGGRCLLSAGTAETGTELFVSDGTAIGTSLLADIAPGAASSTPHDFSVARDRVFFVAYDPEHGEELWSTDGTPSGTRLVQDIAPGAASSLPQGLMAAPRFLFLTADDGTIGREPWIVPLPCVPPLPAFGTRSTPCPVSGDGGGIPGPIKR